MTEIQSPMQERFRQWCKQAHPEGIDPVSLGPWSYKGNIPRPTRETSAATTITGTVVTEQSTKRSIAQSEEVQPLRKSKRIQQKKTA